MNINELIEKYDIQTADSYGEPRYTDPQGLILLANWNDVPQETIDLLEEHGHELEWSDEWVVCHRGKAWRIQADSYHWQSSIVVTDDGELLTRDDSVADWVEYAKIWDASQPPRCVPGWISESDLIEEGFCKHPDPDADDFESGWHEGQTDNPEAIAAAIFENSSDYCEIVFRLAESSQFYVKFQAWVRC